MSIEPRMHEKPVKTRIEENYMSTVIDAITIEPGMHLDLSNEEYHSSAGISKSGLSLFATCPEKYHWEYILGNRDSGAKHLTVGSAFHVATLEPEKFDSLFVVCPDISKNSNAYKIWLADNAGREVLNPRDYDTVMGMAEKVRKHHIAKNLVSGGYAEASFYAIDEATGELVKVRPDYVNGDVLVDLKSTTDASPEKFFRDMYTYSYFVQAGMYPEVINWLSPGKIQEFVFIVVEKETPYSIGLYRASKEDRLYGYDNFRRNLDLFSRYKKDCYWPGYNHDLVIDTHLPQWAKRCENSAELTTR